MVGRPAFQNMEDGRWLWQDVRRQAVRKVGFAWWDRLTTEFDSLAVVLSLRKPSRNHEMRRSRTMSIFMNQTAFLSTPLLKRGECMNVKLFQSCALSWKFELHRHCAMAGMANGGRIRSQLHAGYSFRVQKGTPAA